MFLAGGFFRTVHKKFVISFSNVKGCHIYIITSVIAVTHHLFQVGETARLRIMVNC